MFRIIDGRGTGKTSRLLLLAKENNGIIVCEYPSDMRDKAYAYGLTGIHFYSYEEFLKDQDVCLEYPVFIDDLENFFNTMCCKNLLGYTLNNED